MPKFSYKAKWFVSDGAYVDMQNRSDKKFRLAVGSFKEEYSNHVEIITREIKPLSVVPSVDSLIIQDLRTGKMLLVSC